MTYITCDECGAKLVHFSLQLDRQKYVLLHLKNGKHELLKLPAE